MKIECVWHCVENGRQKLRRMSKNSDNIDKSTQEGTMKLR